MRIALLLLGLAIGIVGGGFGFLLMSFAFTYPGGPTTILSGVFFIAMFVVPVGLAAILIWSAFTTRTKER
jgi:hypothetical protein